MLTRSTFALPLFALLLIVTASIAAAAGVPIQRREGTTSEAADYLCPQTLFTQFLSVPLVSTADPNDADPDAKWIFSLCAADITCGATNAFVSRQYADHCVPLASTLSTVGWVPSLATGVTAVFHGSLVVPNDVVVNVSVACDTDAPMLMSNGPVVKSFASGNATTLFQVWQYDIPLRSMYACPAAAPQTVKFTTMSTDSQALTTIPIALPAGAHQYVVIEPGTSMGLDIVLEVLDSGDNAVCDGPITFDMKRGKPLTPLGPLIDKSIGPAVGNAPSIGGTSSNGDDAPSFSWNGIVSVFASSSMCTDPKQAAIAIHDTGDSIPPPLQLNATSTAVFAWNLANGERNVSAEAKKVLGESGKLAYYVIIESRLDPRKAAGVTCSLNLYVAVHRPGFSVALFVLMVMAFLLMTGVFIFVVRKTWTARAFIRRTDLAVRPPAFPPFHVVLCAIPLLVARSIVLMLKSLALKYHGDVPRRRANSGNGGLRRRAATDEPTPLSGPDMRELDARSSLARSNSSLSPIATASQTTAVPVPSPPAAPAGASTAEEDEKLCRICKEDESQEALIAPCKCTGSIRWMHPSCLAHWRGEAAKRNARYITHCEICQQEFDARLVPKTSVLNLVAARYQFMALCIVVGFVIVMLTGVAVSQGAASVACMDPWHYPWTTFSGVVVLGAAGYLIIHFLLYMAAYSAEREMQALRVAQGQHPRPLAILSEILYPALPKALFAIAYFTVIGYVWLWLLYFSNSNIAWSVEWRVDAGFYWTFVLTTLVLVIADGVAEPTPPADGRGGDPAPLLGGNQQEAVRAPSTVDDVVATDQALNTTRSSLADGSPLIPVAAAATAVLTRVAADTAPMVRESSAVVVDSGRGWRDGGESIDGAMSDRAEEDDEADLVGHHHDAANT